jgi:hypothetical protein
MARFTLYGRIIIGRQRAAGNTPLAKANTCWRQERQHRMIGPAAAIRALATVLLRCYKDATASGKTCPEGLPHAQ